MASPIYSVGVAKECIFDKGFLDEKDLVVGDGISEMERRGFDFFTKYGLEFLEQHVLSTVRMERDIYGIYLMSLSTSYLLWNPSLATKPAFSHTA